MRPTRSRRIDAWAIALTAAAGLSGCEFITDGLEASADQGAVAPPLTTQTGWSVRSRPVLAAGDLKSKGLWNDPCVLRVGDEYVMYVSSSTKEPFKAPVLPFRALSTDGIEWRLDPAEPLLSPEGTPFVSLETPTVVQHKGQWHMYFTGIYPAGTVPTMAIGHATSPDGVRWTLDQGGQPVIKATGHVPDWNGFLVAEPGAIVRDDKIYLYFTAMGGRKGGSPPQIQVIALATSSDGTHFDAPQSVLAQSALFPPEQGYVGYSTPAATVHDGAVHLFYDVAYYNSKANPQWSQVALQHAVSADGRTFVEDAAPILTRESLGFTKGETLGPCALIEDGKVKMWFQGHAGASGFMREFLGTGRTDNFGVRFATIDFDRLGAAP